jgi:hypothetical protein
MESLLTAVLLWFSGLDSFVTDPQLTHQTDSRVSPHCQRSTRSVPSPRARAFVVDSEEYFHNNALIQDHAAARSTPPPTEDDLGRAA